MNFKTKAIGLLAGSALALSLAGGVMAQTQDVGDATVDLADGSPCAASVTTAGNFDFGNYKWNGTAYVYVDGETSTNVVLSVSNSEFGTDTCTVAVSADDLTGTTGNLTSIPGTSISFVNTADSSTGSSFELTVPPTTALTLDATLDMSGVTTAEPDDTYTGNINVTSVVGS